MQQSLQQVLQSCRQRLVAFYGESLAGLVLYGSCARGDSTDESDIDLLVVLRKPFNFFEELRRIVDVLYPVQMESRNVISARPVSLTDYETGSDSFIMNVREEAVQIR